MRARADVNDSRIIGPNGQGPEQQLAVATRQEELLVADIVPQTFNSVRRHLQRGGSRAIFKQLAREMLTIVDEAEAALDERATARL